MIVECPNCKSTFKVANNIDKKSFSNFKCSVCGHLWKIKAQNEGSSVQKSINNYSYVLILNLILIVITLIAFVVFKDRLVYSNIFWNEFYEFFLKLIPVK